jgi:DNA polymerase-3 subunit delta'
MAFEHIRGQQAALSILQRALDHDRLAQSYLFVGPSGVGKERVARELAHVRLCPSRGDHPPGKCEVLRRMEAGAHPDVRVFPPRDEGNRNLQVEFVRDEILPLAKFAPFEAEAAFLIFPEADVSFPVQHAEAANALLKTLEEPRPGVHFLLLSERPDRLLTTIRSRCQRVRFAPLAADVLDAILTQHEVPETARRAAVALSGGRADVALSLSADERAERMLQWALSVDGAARERKPGALLGLGEELARSDDRDMALESLALFYRDVAAAAVGAEDAELAFGHRAETIRERAASLSAADAAARVAAIEQTQQALERNANAEVALDGLLFRL